MRGAPLDFARNIGRQGVGVSPQKQMDMVWLNSQLQDLPSVLLDHLLNDLFQPVMHWPNKHLAPSLGAPDEMVDHQMDTVTFMLILHVDSLPSIKGENKSDFSPSQGCCKV